MTESLLWTNSETFDKQNIPLLEVGKQFLLSLIELDFTALRRYRRIRYVDLSEPIYEDEESIS